MAKDVTKKEEKVPYLIKGAMDWVFNLSSDEVPLSTGQVKDAAKIKRAYTGIVYACVSLISKDVAATAWEFQNDAGEKLDEESFDGYARLKKPNLLHTWVDFIELTQTFLELAGNAYWYVEKSQLGKPTGNVWLIPPYYIKPVPKVNEIGIDFYRVIGLKGVKRFEVDEIVHLKYPNPNDLYLGMGTLDAALVEADINNFAKRYVMEFYKNGAIPAGVLSTDEKISPADAQRIESVWNTKFQGVGQGWNVAVLWGGFKYQPLSLNPATEKFIEQSNWTREDIAAIFKVPLSKLGIVEDVNRANGEVNDATYWENCIDPKLRLISRKINEELLPKLGIAAKFVFENVVKEDVQSKLDIDRVNLQKAQIGGALGVLTTDEIRKLLGFDESADGELVQPEDVEKFVNALKELARL